MKARTLVLMLLLFVGLCSSAAAATLPADPGWPRVIKKEGRELTIYQPQVDSWEDYRRLHLRCAIALKEVKAKKETFGVAEMDAETVVDQAARVVAIIPKTRELRFPNTTEAEAAALQRIVEQMHPPAQALTVSLDRLLAALEPEKQPLQHAVALSLDPPKVLFSRQPAILVMITDQPQLKAVVPEKNELMFVSNTNWDILYDVSGQRYYLLNGDNWLSTADLAQGPWEPAIKLPASFASLPQDDNWADVRANIPGKSTKERIAVFVSEVPAELILTQGEPVYAPIAGTKLMRISNTEAVVFLHAAEGQYYLLSAGRWFRARSLDGPWAVASNDLPKDFAAIPDQDPAAFVKASVPGTIQAKDAVLLASVPTSISVEANTPPKVQVAYKGAPNFQSIPSTTVQFAINTASAVFLVNGAYYCCEQGIWYSANSPTGLWSYCTNVPAAIYTIPASHPAHNVTYVVVQQSTPTTVVYSQTAGYSGEYVAANGVLMFGAGMVVGALLNEAWDDNYHYPVPYSYGWGARYHYGYGGFYRPPYVPYYGPYRGASFATAYNPYTGTYARGATVYGPGGSASRWGAYNTKSGAIAGGKRIETPYGAAGRGAYYNPSTGLAARGGYRSGEQGSVAGVRTNRDTGALAWDTAKGQGMVVKGKEGNVYAGKDGNVYRRDSDGDWQPVNPPPKGSAKQSGKEQRLTTKPTQRPSALASGERKQMTRPQPEQPLARRQSPANTGDLERQFQARSRGDQLTENRRNFNQRPQSTPVRNDRAAEGGRLGERGRRR